MSKETDRVLEIKLQELERLIRDFKEKLEDGVSDASQFITMHEIERLWAELRSNTDNLYSDMVQDFLSSTDEREIIRKKKDSIASKESNCEPTDEIKRPS